MFYRIWNAPFAKKLILSVDIGGLSSNPNHPELPAGLSRNGSIEHNLCGSGGSESPPGKTVHRIRDGFLPRLQCVPAILN
jgi:hypothetical protein